MRQKNQIELFSALTDAEIESLNGDLIADYEKVLDGSETKLTEIQDAIDWVNDAHSNEAELTDEGADTQIDGVTFEFEGSHIVVTDNSTEYPDQTPGEGGDQDKIYVGVLVKAPIEGEITAIYYNDGTKDVKDGADFVKLYLPIAEKGEDDDFVKAPKDKTEMTFTFIYANGVEVTKTVSYEVK